jgi:hypothetical protein
MTTFNWTISAAERAVSKDGLSDVIQTVHWRYRGTDENGITAETYGATSIGDPNPQDFTPFDEVTSADVQGWLESIMSVVPEIAEGEDPKPTQLQAMQANLQAQIDLLITPTTITGPLYSAPVVEVEEIIIEEESI